MKSLVIIVALAVCTTVAVPIPQATAAEPTCGAAGYRGSQGIAVKGRCYGHQGSMQSDSRIRTKSIFCGRPSSRENWLWDRACGAPKMCVRVDKATGGRVVFDAYATLRWVHGRWAQPQTWCPSNRRPGIDVPALRDRAWRLLPKVGIGAAWSDHALVNAQTLLWADTDTDRTLPDLTVLGQQVQLRIHFQRASWNFGDGEGDTVTTPGKAYTNADPCHVAQCPHYYGHTYTQTGQATITLAVTWRAEYRPAGSSWTAIPGTLTGPTDRHTLQVNQARGVLVPNPGD